ncbi:hypothetical protein [Corynebacterium minutissimum]|uniref:hypothetical protein n=1 Tax=Corynebacterium minutissimum TaxID=38301 RepID=UPI001EF3B370|nr:hypothetical protein [Corynebacterium minutissimum]
MKNYYSFRTAVPHSTPSSIAAGELTADILFHHADTLNSVESIIRHPRSLARPTPQWRPPSKSLPSVPLRDEEGEATPPLTLTVSRHRVGERVKARVLGFGEKRVPSYLITVRITSPTGQLVSPAIAEAWVRALVPANLVTAVHEISSSSAATFVWLVDSSYTPVRSPLSLFEDFSQAA